MPAAADRRHHGLDPTRARPGNDAHAALLNGISRAGFLLLTGVVLFALTRERASPLLRFTPLMLILVAWLDVLTHEPRQNPTVPPGVYEPNLARKRLAMNPQPELGGSRAMLSPSAALELTRFAVSDPKNNFLAKRIGYCANLNLLDATPKVDGFFSLTPREFDGLLSLIYSVTNGDWYGAGGVHGRFAIHFADKYAGMATAREFPAAGHGGTKARHSGRHQRALGVWPESG